MSSLVRIVAFAGKEIRHVLRQPRLMIVLVIGPFVILGLFAAGFQPDPPPLRTLLVLPEGSQFEQRISEFEEQLSDDVEVVGSTSDEQAARRDLSEGDVDLVVVTPADAVETIRSDEHATVMVYHDRLDPFDRAFIAVSARSAVDELNRVVLSEVAAVAQERAGDYDEALPAARESAAHMAEALESGDETEAREARSDALESLGVVESQVASSSNFLEGFDQSVGSSSSDSDSLTGTLSDFEGRISDIDPADPAAVEDARAVEADLAELERALADFQSVSPEVIVQPFVAETKAVVGEEIPLTTYYAPAVVVVLLQHVVLTFAALSIVGERSLGTTELFRVGPLRTGELVAGKFLGYASIGLVVAGLLIALVVVAFGAPVAGSVAWLLATVGLTIAASLGLGFLIASVAGSEAQAVQFSMMALLFTIFFSGLVVSLSRLLDAVRPLAYLVPATAGTEGLQDVMFRGVPPSASMLAILGGYVVVSFGLAYLWLRRRQVA